jgi:chromatin remodeling complex protein RSC6
MIYNHNKSKMVRASKSSVATPAPVVETPVVAPAPVVEDVKAKTATKRASKPKKADAEVAAPAPVVAAPAAPAVEEVAATSSSDEAVETTDKTSIMNVLLAEIADFNKNYQSWMSSSNALKANIKNISKISSRVSKTAEKSTKRRKNAKSKPSGFEKPTLISEELAVFFERPVGSRMARTEVSKKIHEYVTNKNLQNAANRRIIHPDEKLKQLLKVDNDELTYFNLQKFLKFHFKKEEAAPVARA